MSNRKLEFYTDEDGKHWWQIECVQNGKVVHKSEQGYCNKSECVENVKEMFSYEIVEDKKGVLSCVPRA